MMTIGTLQQMKTNIGMVLAGANQVQVQVIKGNSTEEESESSHSDIQQTP